MARYLECVRVRFSSLVTDNVIYQMTITNIGSLESGKVQVCLNSGTLPEDLALVKLQISTVNTVADAMTNDDDNGFEHHRSHVPLSLCPCTPATSVTSCRFLLAPVSHDDHGR